MKTFRKILIHFNITAFVAVMLFSCSNPDALISVLATEDTLTGIIADSVTFFSSDSGVVKLELRAPRLVRFEDNDKLMEFPLGFEVIMYDNQHEPITSLRAGYGKSIGGGLIEAQDSVVVRRNSDEQVMYSDKLFWYQDRKMIHTRSHVRIVTPDKEIEADSLVAMEDFSEYTMYSGRAVLDVDE